MVALNVVLFNFSSRFFFCLLNSNCLLRFLNLYELFYDTRSGDEWDKDNNGYHSCGDSNETEKKLNSLSRNHDIVAKMDSIEKVDPANQLETKSLEDRNSKLDNSELVMILRQTKMLKYLQETKWLH
ncbi:unnamed protein product [Brassica rapa subsp. trilocularis]